MPVVTIDWLIGRTIKQKRKISEVITKTIAEEGGTEPESVIVIFNERPRTDIAKAGKLWSDQ